jgi:hypothetical protein
MWNDFVFIRFYIPLSPFKGGRRSVCPPSKGEEEVSVPLQRGKKKPESCPEISLHK